MGQQINTTGSDNDFACDRYFKDDLVIIATVLVASIGCVVALRSIGVAGIGRESWWLGAVLYSALLMAVVVAEILWLLAVRRPTRPIRPCLFYVRRRYSLSAVPRSLPLIGCTVVFMPLFSEMKSNIPLFHAYQWDATFIALDGFIHGDDPWRLLQPVLGHPFITAAIAELYLLWILLIYAGTVFMSLYVKDKALRRRYFASFFAIWLIVGTVLAICFASVGPCFVGQMFGNTHYREQIAYLHMANQQYPVTVLMVQEMLLKGMASHSHALGQGISAMPSMHVALAFLFFLAMRKVSRKAGWFFGAFFVVILIGSVHLGYHYAVDGYVSILVTLLIWKVAGLWPAHEEGARRVEATPPTQQAIA